MKRLPTHAVMGYARRKGWIDIPGGFALMRDRAVPVGSKLSALGLGFLLMLVLQALEVPLETAVDAMSLGLAVPFTLAIDGLEFLILPVLFGAAILSRMIPRVPTFRP